MGSKKTNTKGKSSTVNDDEQEEISQDDTPISNDSLEQIRECGSIIVSGGYVIHCLTIIGQIEGHNVLPPQNKTTKYEHVIPQLVAIEESKDIDGVLVLLNTAGGDVEAGLAIAEVLAGLKKPTVSIVLGGGHSIGIPLAVASKRSFIAKTGTMTIHPVRTNGLVMGVPQQFTYFNDMQERIIEFVSENSSVEKDVFRNLMMNSGQLVADFGTVLDGKESVENGLIDEVGTIIDAVEYLIKM